MKALHLARVLDHVRAAEPREARRGGGLGLEILHHRDALLRARDEDRPERRSEEPEAHQAAAQIGEAGREPRPRQRRFRLRERRAAELGHDALDGTVVPEGVAARRTARRVLLDGARRRGRRLTAGEGQQIRLDRPARRIRDRLIAWPPRRWRRVRPARGGSS